jgi:hypothetical protein
MLLDFLRMVEAECQEHVVDFQLIGESKLWLDDSKKIDVGGYFDESGPVPVLAVAANNDRWIEILAHEYGHMQQWKEGLFKDEKGYYAQFDEWVSHKIELSPEAVEIAVDFIQCCELDAEQRSFKILKKYLDYDKQALKTYIQRSNAYVLLYTICKRRREWVTASPSAQEAVWRHAPKRWARDFSKIPPKLDAQTNLLCFIPRVR